MFTEDFIRRQIRMAAAFLAQVLLLRKSGQAAEAGQAIEQALEQLTGINYPLLQQLDDDAWLDALSFQEELDVELLLTVAQLVRQQGELFAAQGNTQAGIASLQRSLLFFLEASLEGELKPEEAPQGEIDAILSQLELKSLPTRHLLALLDYSEQYARPRQAIEIYDVLSQNLDLADDLIEDQRAYLQELLGWTDKQLARAGLSRLALQNRLQRLEQRK
jgi:hypothetical protein